MSKDQISVPRELLEAIAGGGYCKADVMQRLQSLIDQRCTCPSGDGSLRWPCPVHQAEATVAASFSDGIEAAAKLIERRMDEYVNEHGSYDHDTGYTEFPGNGEETVEEWLNLAEGIRAIKAPCHSAEPVGLYDLGDGKGLVPLYRHPPDQAPVVLPSLPPAQLPDFDDGWESYEAEFKRLNPGITEAAPLRKS